MTADTRMFGRTARATALLLVAAAVAFTLTAGGAAPSGTSSAPAGPTSSAAGVQHFDVDMSSGDYVPKVLTAKAGTPVQITFGQGQGCVGTLVFSAFGIQADMTQGPKTFDLGVLEPGEYEWACGMDMQHGVLRVE